ncbi:MAG: response regulator [Candidatus Omnitrophota bacterium]
MDKKKVMIVDDEEDFTKITKLNLEATGKFEVFTLSNAKDIISHVHKFAPDLILLDILMPKIGGIEACEMLNNDSAGKGIPIIVLSALDKYKDKANAYKLGIVDYIVKPIDKSALISKIEKALQFK